MKIIIIILAISCFIVGFILGEIYEAEKFNEKLLVADGYYWIDVYGNRSYLPLNECVKK